MKKKNTIVSKEKQTINNKRKNPFRFYLRQAIIIIAVIACSNSLNAQTASNFVKEERYTFIVNQPEIKMPEAVTINGTVKDEEGKPLANATVKAVSGDAYTTDANGLFSFTLRMEQVKSQSIFISYDGLVTAIRSYNPVMVNTSYDVTLYKPKVCCPKKMDCKIAVKPSTIYFKLNSSILSEETKKQIDIIANQLKECPTATIQLTANTGTQKSLKALADQRLNAIKKYLIEKNGISADRISTNKETDNLNSNSVDITPQ